MTLELFIRDGNKIKIAQDEIFLYPELKPILTKYGKDSVILDKVCSYLYFSCHPKAVPQVKGYSLKEAHKYATVKAGLSEKFEITNEIKIAQKFCKTEWNNNMIEYIQNVIKSLRVSNKICRLILDSQDIETDTSVEQIQKVATAIKEILSLTNSINTAIPKLVENIRELKLLEEEEAKINSDRKLRGGDEVPDSYDMTDEEDD